MRQASAPHSRHDRLNLKPLTGRFEPRARLVLVWAISLSLLSLVQPGLSVASPHRQAAVPKISPQAIRLGTVSDWSQSAQWIGGEARTGFTLADLILESMRAPAGRVRERWSMVLADRRGAPWTEGPGYFQALVSRGGRRLTIELSQIVDARRAPLLEALAPKSRLVSDMKLFYDAKDGSASLVFDFKRPVAVRLSAQNGETQLWFEAEGSAPRVRR
jgi:hypothetical protein